MSSLRMLLHELIVLPFYECHAFQRKTHGARAVHRRRDASLERVPKLRRARVKQVTALLFEHLGDHVGSVNARCGLISGL